jgi:hypothetical protein
VDELIELLRALARHEHSDVSIAEEAAAEIEALRAKVEDYRKNGAYAVRFAPNSAYWSAELRRLFGDDARNGIGVLEQWHRDSLDCAERLAEALRIARARAADLAAWLKSGNDVPADLPFVFRERWQKIANDIRALEAALAQEDRNG